MRIIHESFIFYKYLRGGYVCYVMYVAQSLMLLHLIRRSPAHRPQMPQLHYIARGPNIPEKRDSRCPWQRLIFVRITANDGERIAETNRK